MKRFLLAMLALGIVLLGVIVARTDLSEVWLQLRELGLPMLLLLLGIYLLGTVALAASWHLTLLSAPLRPLWLLRLWQVWLVGTALEFTTPLGTLGGEPAKVILLKRHHGLRVRDVTSSLVLNRLTDLLAQVLFISVGFACMLRAELLPLPYRLAAGSGLVLLSLGAGFFFVAQNQRMLSRLRRWLDRGFLAGRELSARVRTALDALHDIDEQLVVFHRARRGRFWLSAGAALLEWTSAAFATWLAVNALGHGISPVEALIIEAFVTLVRSTFFFVPGDVGTQEGALVLICGAVTGSPATGLALAAIRRTRDFVVVAAGLAIGSHLSLRDVSEEEALAEVAEAEGRVVAPGPAASPPRL